jgi:YspA, cpYpsA-related SLOG family
MKNQERIIIAGSRNFNDYQLLYGEVEKYLDGNLDVVIVSGAAKGADTLGERYAADKGIPLKRYPADWAKNGKAAGPIRNEQMAQNADTLIAFWDGGSRGTKNMIDVAQKHGLLVKVIYFEQ